MATGCPDGPKNLEEGAPYADEGAPLGPKPEEPGAAGPAGAKELKRAPGEAGPPKGVLRTFPLPPALWAPFGGR